MFPKLLFVNTLMAIRMYSHHIWQEFPQQVQTQLSQIYKNIVPFFIALLKST